MKPLSMPMASFEDMATGPRRLVDARALEMTLLTLGELVVVDAVDNRQVG